MLNDTNHPQQLKREDLVLISLLVGGDYDPVSTIHIQMG